eukprot:TRINITY_DN2474_c1_g1_i1.p1 TRINITY_DN2474_c1_g1~~TRINITY_DN2474_c1_g1_i1.p1  ORF type:complete len:248 (+),score=65.33 TRINITY_DN2474_c1_g1_i1:29-745(+)
MDLSAVQRELRMQYQHAKFKWGCLSHSLQSLITINCAVFAASRVPSVRHVVYRHTTCGWENTIKQRRFHTLFTSVFAHGSAMHLLFNCYAATIFTPLLERSMFRKNKDYSVGSQATMFIIASAVMANVVGLFLATAILPLRVVPTLGLSGGLYSGMTVVAQREPDMKWHILFLPQPVSSETFLSCILGFDTLGLMYFLFAGGSTGLAHHIHLAGACIGAASQEYWLPQYRSSRGFWGW